MARFRFPMQNILKMKEKLEEQAKNEYGQANARLLAEEKKLEQLNNRLEDARLQLKNVLREVLSMTEIHKRENAVVILKGYVKQQLLVGKRCEKEVEIAREKLTEAMKERKIFEKLREKAFDEFMKEEGRREQKEVDELMSYRYGAKNA